MLNRYADMRGLKILKSTPKIVDNIVWGIRDIENTKVINFNKGRGLAEKR